MNTKEILVTARKRIEEPANWTQGFSALDYDGDPVEPTSEHAQCWCMAGAVYSVLPEGIHGREAFEALERAICGEVNGDAIPNFNDDSRRSHGEVLAMFDHAIAALTPAP